MKSMVFRLTTLALVCATFTWTRSATAQSADSTQTPPVKQGKTAFVRGVVVDTLGHPIVQANVMLAAPKRSASDSLQTILSTTTDDKGRFTLARVPAKGQYVILARKLGFGVASSKAMSFAGNDTTEIRFELTLNELTPVFISAPLPQAYRIDSTEINKHAVHDALDVIMNYRPRMMGDAYKNCRPDTSHYTNGIRYFRRGPKYLGDTLGAEPLRLFINGVWHGEQSIKNILADIPAEDILEMRYISCWDTVTPQYRNSLMVILKPGASY